MRLPLAAAVAVCALATPVFAQLSAAPAPARLTQRTLSFADRVHVQETIERLYYRHQIGATKTFDEAVPHAVIEAKVRRYLEESAALEAYWHTPITDEALQRELDRMAGATRMPERLQEIYAALRNDTFLIKECVARATLADRLANNFYAYDSRYHAAERGAIDALHDQITSGALSPKADQPNRTVRDIAVTIEGQDPPAPTVDAGATQADLGQKRAQFPSAGIASPVTESRESFSFDVVLSETATSIRVATYVVPKVAWSTWWSSTRAAFHAESVTAVATDRVKLPAPVKGATFDPNAPCTGDGWNNGILDDLPSGRVSHVAVWTGSIMLVWGGYTTSPLGPFLDTGGRYDPVTDTWQAMTTVNAPVGRPGSTAVWAGTEMIVWGGYSFATQTFFVSGGRYDPIADRWTTIALAPSARAAHTAVWDGRRMIVWGGYDLPGSTQVRYLNTGEIYDPSTNSWTPMSTTGAPNGRRGHSAVWTGREMIVWGGVGNSIAPDVSGGRYNPITDSWSPMAQTTGRTDHATVWTGSSMIVWGGQQLNNCSYCGPDNYYYVPSQTGDRYDPVHDRWIPTSLVGAPFYNASPVAVWTGHDMIVLRNDASAIPGGRYDPSTDHWTPVAPDDESAVRQQATVVWTGRLAIIWGGFARYASHFYYLNTGRRYDPWNDAWTPTSTSSPASQRTAFTTVWTGSQMIVWGGTAAIPQANALGTGGAYDPTTDNWMALSTDSAPEPRTSHSAVWAGNEMLVWGGSGLSGLLGSGSRYDPNTDIWRPISDENAPSPRYDHAAGWTGTRMVVWGGAGGSSISLQSGGVFDPATDQWAPTSLVNAPVGRQRPTVVWTGLRLVFWGGFNEGGNFAPSNTGGQYDPDTDTWTATSLVGAPSPRQNHSAAWVANRMVVLGGVANPFPSNISGGRYDPETDTWTPTTIVGAPLGLTQQGAVVVGNSMLEWGGTGFSFGAAAGGIYDVANDRWTKITVKGQPMPSAVTAVWTGDSMIVWSGNGGGRYYLGQSLDNDCDGDGVSVSAGDCDDHDPATYPGAPEVCDGVGNNCTTRFWPSAAGEIDNDRDGWLVCAGDCDDNNPYVHPGQPEACDGWDTDCDGTDPRPTEADADHDGYRICEGDCDDTNFYIHPGAYEYCNGRDDNCDGRIDEGGDALCTTDHGCWAGTCSGALGCTNLHTTDGPCDDGNSCTVDDHCENGYCRGTYLMAGSPCDDGNACTTNDQCLVGYCYGGPQLDCGDDGDDCNGREYCDYASQKCAVYDVLNGCDDGNICTTDSCDQATGCHHDFNTDPCDDGNACTTGDVCADGLCQAGAPADCDDGNPCTDDSCEPWAGCVHANNSAACDDGNACTGWDACEDGVCVGHDPVVCPVADQCHVGGACDPATGSCSYAAKPDGTTCDDGDLCTTGETCQAGTCTPAFSGLTEPNPRTDGYYRGLCHGSRSGDQLTDADARCVGALVRTFAGFATVADLCAELTPSQPNNDPCDRTDDDLVALALNICRARVCTAQSIESQCGANTSVGQSLSEVDAILADAGRNGTTCALAKCLAEEVNTGRALGSNSLRLAREAGGIRLSWTPPYLDDGNGAPSQYHVWRRVRGSSAPFTKLASTSAVSYLDATSGDGAFEYEVTAVMN